MCGQAGCSAAIDFDLMDRPVRVTQSGTSSDFSYAPDGARYRQKITANPGPVDSRYGPRTVYYVDKDYELVVWDDLQTEERTYVGGAVVLYRANGGARQERYLHLDRLGSVDAVTTASAGLFQVDLHGYDPFGKPRGEPWTPSQDRLHPGGDRPSQAVTTDRGFTGHEHLDVSQLIHMNGRMYDYRLARFLSVDPIISNPMNSQSLNAYSYIGNNPLSGVDPTGYAGVAMADSPGSSARDKIFANELSYSSSQVISFGGSNGGGNNQKSTLPNTNTADHGGPPDTNKQQDVGKNEAFLDKATKMAKGTLLGAAREVLKVGGQFSMALGLETERGYQSTLAQFDASLEGQPPEALAAGEQAARMGFTLLTVKGIGEAVPSAPVPSGIELLYAGSKKAPLPVEQLRTPTGFVSDATVSSKGTVIGRGTVDVRATVEGIQSGKLSPRAIFENREGLLPKQGPGYYREFVHPTPGVSGTGPQRIVGGKGGELYYTPDHYRTFVPLN